MRFQKTPIALAAITMLGAAFTAQAAPTVTFSEPDGGETFSQYTSNSSACEATGSRIASVTFSLRRSGTSTWTTLNTDSSSPWRCTIDPSRFATGQYVLRAVARDSSGATASTSRTINIVNNTANTGPTVAFKTPTSGKVLPSGGGLSTCEVSASDPNGVQKVEFYMNDVLYKTDTGAAWTCTFSAGRFPNGSYVLKAVATDKLGAKGPAAQINLTIGGTTTTQNSAPSVAITQPQAGATIAAPVSGTACAANASDTDGSVTRVDFTLSNSSGSTPVGSPTAAPYQCAINTASFANGTYTLTATATDDKGAKKSTSQSLTINKLVSDGPTDGGGSTSAVSSAHIITRASADAAFSTQNGYTAQVINTYTSANSIPESGIHGTVLPTGETLRLGKESDPANSTRKALAFQVRNSDPTTSSGKRAELSISPNIEMNKVYWIAFRAYIHDWGTLATSDNALFGCQMHSGDNNAGVGGPSFGLYTTQTGRTFRVQARYSENADPGTGGVSMKFAEYPIPFEQWTDFVVKFKHNTSGNGLLQVWMNGQMITNYTGSLGYNTGMKDYAKFGYYNWTAANMNAVPRKVMLREPHIVADPTGSTYTHDQLRALANGGSSSSSTVVAGGTSGGTSGGLCSTIECAAQ